MPTLDPQAVAQQIGIPLKNWRGNCFAVARAMERAGLVRGQAVYGLWLGRVARGSIFYGNPIVQHGWVKEPDGTVTDPTRYEFEQVQPYIYVGPAEGLYDEGGNTLLQGFETPCPVFDAGQRVVHLELPAAAQVWLAGHTHTTSLVTVDQAFWLGNLSLMTLGDHAEAVYWALIAAGYGEAIPLDNRRRFRLDR